MAYPTSLPSYTGFTSTHTLAADLHASQHNSEQGDIVAIATKIGTGVSTPTTSKLLRGTGTGASAWAQADLTTDITGVLPVANGGNGTTSTTGTGSAVFSAAPALTGGGSWGGSPTLTTPTIADFTNANHNHQNTAGGGQLTTGAYVNASVTPDKLSTGAATASVATNESTVSASYGDLATVGPTVTVTIGANGLALVAITSDVFNGTNGTAALAACAVTGASTVAANDVDAISFTNNASTNSYTVHGSTVFLVSGLTPGSNTFTMKYRQGGGGTAVFQNRKISVVPL